EGQIHVADHRVDDADRKLGDNLWGGYVGDEQGAVLSRIGSRSACGRACTSKIVGPQVHGDAPAAATAAAVGLPLTAIRGDRAEAVKGTGGHPDAASCAAARAFDQARVAICR